MEQTTVANKIGYKSKPILRFCGVSYHEGDVIINLSDHEKCCPGRASLLLVTYDEEFGMAEIHPISFEVLRVLDPEKGVAVSETLKARRIAMGV